MQSDVPYTAHLNFLPKANQRGEAIQNKAEALWSEGDYNIKGWAKGLIMDDSDLRPDIRESKKYLFRSSFEKNYRFKMLSPLLRRREEPSLCKKRNPNCFSRRD